LTRSKKGFDKNRSLPLHKDKTSAVNWRTKQRTYCYAITVGSESQGETVGDSSKTDAKVCSVLFGHGRQSSFSSFALQLFYYLIDHFAIYSEKTFHKMFCTII